MHKIIISVIKSFLLLGISTSCFSQTETFDIMQYTPPKDWKKDTKQGVVIYTNINATTGGFCMIALYSSTASTGDAQKDFKNEWKELAITPYKAEANPQTETQLTSDGWNAVVGAAPVKLEGIDTYIFLTVFSGFGKTASVLVNLNDQSYLGFVDTLLGNMKLDKSAPVANQNDQSTNSTSGSIFGTWGSTSVSIGNYVTGSGVFIGSADASTMEEYNFKSDNTYLYKFYGSANSKQYYTETTGNFNVNGKRLTLTPLQRRGGYSGAIKDEKGLLGKPETFEFYIGPNKWEPGPFLNLHKDGNYYMYSDFPYDYYKKISNNQPEKNNPSNNNQASEKKTSEPVERFGHMIYTPIKGWSIQKFSNGTIFKPSDLLPNHILEVRILESKPFTGSLKEAMTESWSDALQQLNMKPAYTGTLYDVIRERKSYKGWEYIRARGITRPLGESLDKYDTYMFVIKLNNRIERIAVIGLNNIDFGSFSPHSNPAYADALEEFYFSLQFDDWKEPVVKIGSLKGDGLIGLYEGLKLTGGRLGGAYTVFFSNGQAFSAPKFPTRGMHGINTWIEAERNTGYWGVYTLNNGKGFIKMGSGDIPIKVIGEDIIVTTQNTEHRYEKVPSLDGAVFNGTYVFKGDWGGTSPSITFTSDGNFIDQGAVDILHHTTTDFFNITKEPGSGKYEVKDYTLILNYKDGRKVQIVFQDSDYNKKNPSPETLTFSTNHDIVYKK